MDSQFMKSFFMIFCLFGIIGCVTRKSPEECKTKYERAVDQCEKEAKEGREKVEQMKKACEMIQNPDQKERCMQRVEKEKKAQQQKEDQCKDEAEKQKEACKKTEKEESIKK